jgi:toxin FitB
MISISAAIHWQDARLICRERFSARYNIPSELIRSRPDSRVEKWVYAQDEQSLYLSVVSIGELRRGLVILPTSKRRSELERWFENDLLPRFERRILPVTRSIADRWGALDGQCQLKGTPLNTADGMIAATAIEHGLTVVTRNIRDYAGLGVEALNPWDAV